MIFSGEGFFDRVRSILSSREKLAIVTVVDSKPPSSIKPGYKLIVREDGGVEGWAGGWCTTEEIVSRAIESIESGRPILGEFETCFRGRVLVLIDPIYPPPRVVALGSNRIVSALEVFIRALGYEFVKLERLEHRDLEEGGSPGSLGRVDDETYIVIATLGDNDHVYVERFIDTEARYIAVVANRRRFQSIVRYLQDRGYSRDKISRVKGPAGIDIGAKTPEEIALSIAAEIVMRVRERERVGMRTYKPRDAAASGVEEEPQRVYIDPVCSMTVDPKETPYKTSYRGQEIYFCSQTCLNKYRENPEKYTGSNPQRSREDI